MKILAAIPLPPPSLALYLGRTLGTRILAVMLALTALVQLMDILDVSSRLIQGAGMSSLLTYSALRISMVLERVLPLSVLIGAAIGFLGLGQNNEITMLRAAGVSPYRIMGALLPLGILLGIGHLLIIDQIAPRSERAFLEWWNHLDLPPEKKTKLDSQGRKVVDTSATQKKNRPLWMRSGGEIVSVDQVSDDGTRLDGVVRYIRSDPGHLKAHIRADHANLENGVWVLHGVQTTVVGDRTPVTTRQDSMVWPAGPDLSNLRELTRPGERLTGIRTWDVLRGAWAGSGSLPHYQTRLQKILCAPLVPVLMLLLSGPAMTGGRRTGGLARGMAVSLLMGLAYLLVDGILGSMAETGMVSAPLAVWAAPLSFIAFGVAMLLHMEE